MASLFARLARYSLGDGVDRAEDRVTEALGATLSAAPDAARALAHALTDVTPPPVAAVTRTQRRTDGRERVDVEMRFGPEPIPALRVWLELKDRDQPRADQVERYRRARPDLRGERIVKLVTRTGVATPAGLPVGDHQTWQGVGAALDRWCADQPAGGPRRHDVAMVDELLEYLREEGFYVPGRFDADDLKALQRAQDAGDRLAVAVGDAAALLERDGRLEPGDWDDAASPGWKNGPRDPTDFWRSYPIAMVSLLAASPQTDEPPLPQRRVPSDGWQADEHGRRCWFEWQGRFDPAREDDAPDELGFGAGVAVMPENEFPADRYAGWLAACRAEGYEYARSSGNLAVRYLMRFDTPLAILGDGELDAQARHLAAWVQERFQWLAEHPPYADDASESA